MKKTILLLSLIALSFAGFSQKKEAVKKIAKEAVAAVAAKDSAAQSAGTLTVTLQPQDWEVVLQIINQSAAPHNQVAAVQATLLQQLQAQLKQPAKKE